MSYVHHLQLGGVDATLTWIGHSRIEPARVYALAFVSPDEILLVSGGPGDPDRWLPGGGVEPGETAEEALRRELVEEADAAVVALEDLGSQRLDDPEGRQKVHRFYWCRVTLAPQGSDKPESTLRHVIPAADLLDTLQWGRTDPKAPMLLERALEAERRYTAQTRLPGENGSVEP